MKKNDNKTIVKKLWELMNELKFEELKELLAENFTATWPQSNETFNRNGYIEANRNYPGTHKIEVLNLYQEQNRWNGKDSVLSEISIISKTPEGKDYSLFGLSIFELEGDKITSAREYWAPTYAAPDWRKQWAIES